MLYFAFISWQKPANLYILYHSLFFCIWSILWTTISFSCEICQLLIAFSYKVQVFHICPNYFSSLKYQCSHTPTMCLKKYTEFLKHTTNLHALMTLLLLGILLRLIWNQAWGNFFMTWHNKVYIFQSIKDLPFIFKS